MNSSLGGLSFIFAVSEDANSGINWRFKVWVA